MLPRYLNPHLAHIPTKKTSREEIALHDEIDPSSESNSADIDERLLLLNKLHKRLQDSLDFVAESRKRRKISESQSVVVSTEPICSCIYFSLYLDVKYDLHSIQAHFSRGKAHQHWTWSSKTTPSVCNSLGRFDHMRLTPTFKLSRANIWRFGKICDEKTRTLRSRCCRFCLGDARVS